MAQDAEIQQRLKAGDSSALELIWDVYASDLLGFLIGYVASRADAEDALQDVFVTIARNRDAVAKADHLRAYLFRMARNAAINRMRSDERRRKRHEAAGDWLETVDANTGNAQTDHDRTEKLQHALTSLPSAQRTIIVMRFFRAKNFREIGEMLGISENTVGSRYRYGMKKLRTSLEEGES